PNAHIADHAAIAQSPHAVGAGRFGQPQLLRQRLVRGVGAGAEGREDLEIDLIEGCRRLLCFRQWVSPSPAAFRSEFWNVRKARRILSKSRTLIGLRAMIEG